MFSAQILSSSAAVRTFSTASSVFSTAAAYCAKTQRVDGEAAMLNYTPNLFRKTTGEPQDL